MHEIGWLCRSSLDCGSDGTRGCATHTRNMVVIISIIHGSDHFARLVGEK